MSHQPSPPLLRVKRSFFDGQTGSITFRDFRAKTTADLIRAWPTIEADMLRWHRNPLPRFGLRVADPWAARAQQEKAHG